MRHRTWVPVLTTQACSTLWSPAGPHPNLPRPAGEGTHDALPLERGDHLQSVPRVGESQRGGRRELERGYDASRSGLPQTEIGADPIAVRDYAQAAQSLGYDHLVAFDHVIGANDASRPGWRGYRHTDSFYEPLVLFGYLAGFAPGLELVTGILILPQRQTALVAKQAATLDVLSGGKLRLAIGIGWNPVEYEAWARIFTTEAGVRRSRSKCCVPCGTHELVTFEGRWHKITDAGINPLPVQRPIPVWFGGHADEVLRRTARLGDGCFPTFRPDDYFRPDADGRASIERMRSYAREEGRDPSSIGLESWISIGNRPPEEWATDLTTWKELGATQISVNTMKAGLTSPDGHIDAIRRFKEVVDGL